MKTDPYYEGFRGFRYDLESVLHYGPLSMAKNPSSPVFDVLTCANSRRPGQLDTEAADVGQRVGMSAQDVAEINELYGCQSE